MNIEQLIIENNLYNELSTQGMIQLKLFIKDVIQETLKLASENANAYLESYPHCDDEYAVVDKQSILDVIKQIKI